MSLQSLPLRFLRALVFGSLLCAAMGAHAAALPGKVREALEAQGIALENVAVWVQAVEDAQPRLSLNAARPMNPASVMKLVTTFAALDRLGPAYTWITRASVDTPPRDGAVSGNLYLVGSGDPVLSYERLWKLLRQLRALGVTRVAGDIVLDGSALRLPPHDPAAFDGRGLRPYNAGAHGMLLNFNAIRLTLVPAAQPGAPVGVAADPPLAGLAVESNLVTASGACGTWYGNLEAMVDQNATAPRLVINGSLPAACGRRDWNVAPLATDQYLIGLVSSLWADAGGLIDGRVRVGTAPPEAIELLTDESHPLADVVHDMNKWSNNVIARQLLATLGASAAPDASMDTVASGASVLRSQLEAAGISTADLVIENGAGLSRIDRIRADTLGQMLLAAWARPWMPEFVASMPLAGVDGTARKRLDGSPVRGRAHIKTGTLDGVRTLAGYVLDRHGRRHAVVMLVNDPRADASQAAQDALLEWVWAGEPPAVAAGKRARSP